MIEKFANICRTFPEVKIPSSADRTIKRLRLGIEPTRYMGLALAVSGLVFCVLALLLGSAGGQTNYGMVLGESLLGFALVFAFFLVLPGIEHKKRASQLEAELPYFLRSLGMYLELGIQFEQALQIAAEEFDAIKCEIAIALNDIHKGIGLRSSLTGISATYDSVPIKQVMTQIIFTYESGASGRDLVRFGKEMISQQQHRLKEYAAKSAVFGLMFIMTSAIIPTFFLIYAILGKTALKSNITNEEIALALLIVFPLLSVLVQLISRIFMPRTPGEKGNDAIDFRMGFPVFLFLVGTVAFREYQFVFLSAGVMIAAYLSYENYVIERRKENIEKYLPDALLGAGGMGKALRLENLLESFERGEYGALSVEAAKSKKQLSANLRTDSVLDDLGKRNNSTMLKNACKVIRQMILTNSLDRIDLLAEDILMGLQISRERGQLLALQKYTLIAGGLLVPLILKMALGLLGTTSALFDDRTGQETLAFASSLIPAYLTIYAMIAAIAIADSEGKRSDASKYFLLIGTAALMIFFLISF